MSEQKFKLVQTEEIEEEEKEDLIADDEEKLSGFSMECISDHWVALVLKDVPSDVYFFDFGNLKIATEVTVLVQRGGTCIKMSPDKKHLMVAGTSKTVYIFDSQFILTEVLKKSPEEIKKKVHNYLKKKIEKGKKKSMKGFRNFRSLKRFKRNQNKDLIGGVPKDFVIELKQYHSDLIFLIQFIENGEKMVSAGGKQIKVFDFSRRSVESFFDTSHSEAITRMIFLSNEKQIITSSED